MKLLFKFQKLLPFIFKYGFLLFVGGASYFYLEILYRGNSHISMFFCGGLSFVLIGAINQVIDKDMSIISQMVIGSFIITMLEFITGLIVNIWLKLDVWDYSNIPFNFMGQICLPFTNLWFILSLVCIFLDDFIRVKIFEEPKPTYHIF